MATEDFFLPFFFCIYIKIQFACGDLPSDACYALWDKVGQLQGKKRKKKEEN